MTGINRKITVKYPPRNGCRNCYTPIPAGAFAWYIAGNKDVKGLRCPACGPDPAFEMGERQRRTRAEMGYPMAPAVPSTYAPPATTQPISITPVQPTTQPTTMTKGSQPMATNETSTAISQLASALSLEVREALEGRIASLETELKEATKAIAEQVAKAGGGGGTLTIEVSRPDKEPITIKGAHKQLPEVIDRVKAGLVNVWLTGPAGTGKSTIAEHVAKAFDVMYGNISLSEGFEEWQLLGSKTLKGGNVEFETTDFLTWYENGGIFALEEIDRAQAGAIVILNNALANNSFRNPVNGRLYNRHKDAIAIATANTFGLGADAVYVGAAQLDGATLDRFIGGVVAIDYDTDLEVAIAESIAGTPGRQVAQHIHVWRKALGTHTRRILSTRMVIAGCKLTTLGWSSAQVKGALTSGWTKDELAKLPL